MERDFWISAGSRFKNLIDPAGIDWAASIQILKYPRPIAPRKIRRYAVLKKKVNRAKFFIFLDFHGRIMITSQFFMQKFSGAAGYSVIIHLV